MTRIYSEAAIQERRGLIAQIASCHYPVGSRPPRKPEEFKGTEAELLLEFNRLSGIVMEYKDGGDQMEEAGL